jgi:hypothetical protein
MKKEYKIILWDTMDELELRVTEKLNEWWKCEWWMTNTFLAYTQAMSN